MSNGNSYIGQQIGNYLVIKELASGSFGSVYQGRHMVFTDEPIVAIKLLHAHLASQQEYDRFFQEARLLKKLKYPYILPNMAPEQFRGIISKESDQYGLGCIAYELFTGSKPFNAPDFFALGYKHLTAYPIAPTQF